MFLTDWTRRTRMQQHITRELRALGGNVLNIAMDTHTVISDHPLWLPTFMQPLTPSRVNFILLEGPQIGDEQVAMAAELPGIQGLEINFSVITDVTLLKLQRRTSLIDLHLIDVTTISEKAFDQFRETRPNCQIHR